jgi:hypothetical protein
MMASSEAWTIAVRYSADGKRFLVEVQPGQQNTQTPITVVLNWAADLKK